MYVYEFRDLASFDVTTEKWVEGPCYVVGFFPPNSMFQVDSAHATREKAAARVHYLNGGTQGDRCDCDERLEQIRKVLGA